VDKSTGLRADQTIILTVKKSRHGYPEHLRTKSFYGTSPNAVKTQIWIAITVYLLVAIAKKRFYLPGSLYTILQIIEVNVFEKTPLNQVVNKALKQKTMTQDSNQLNLFDS
jgi:hypothetical protein